MKNKKHYVFVIMKKYTQAEASSFMNVSRPTLTRIYMSAREKLHKHL